MVASVVAHLNPNVVANAVWKHIVTIVSYFLPILFIIAPKISQKIRPTSVLLSQKVALFCPVGNPSLNQRVLNSIFSTLCLNRP